MRVLIRPVVVAVCLFAPAFAPAADLDKGLAAYSEGDYETALANCMPLAEAGDPGGQFCVGRMYANGFGVDMDDAAALKWYGLAAEAGHAEAQYNLGVMHANGWGVPMDDAAAVAFYRQSAEQGFRPAMISLAYVIAHGIGVQEDLVESYVWYDVAARLGDLSAAQKRDDLGERLNADDLLRARDGAMKWLEGFEGETLHAGRLD